MKTKPTKYIGGILNGVLHDTDQRAEHIHITVVGRCDDSKASPQCWRKTGTYSESFDADNNRIMTWRKKPL